MLSIFNYKFVFLILNCIQHPFTLRIYFGNPYYVSLISFAKLYFAKLEALVGTDQRMILPTYLNYFIVVKFIGIYQINDCIVIKIY